MSAPSPAHVDQFYGKMKTPVGATSALEAAAIRTASITRSCSRRSSWEFTKRDRVDTVGFVACCAVSGGILWVFAQLLRAAAGRKVGSVQQD